MQVHSFPGGLTLDPHKAQSLSAGLQHAALPARLRLPLAQSAGIAAQPIVTIGQQLLGGQCIASAPGAVPVHAPSSGTVSAIGRHPVIHASGIDALCIDIECDGEDRQLPAVPDPDWRTRSASEWLDRIHAAGIVGLGGGVFPTAQKLKLEQPLRHLILNGAECEPYIACDNALLIHYAGEVLAAAELFERLLNPERLTLALEDNMHAALAALRKCPSRVEITTVPTRYPEGGERQLIYALSGVEVPADKLPTDVGALSINVATARAAWRAVTLGEALCTRIVTVTGSGVQRPGNYEVRLGTLLADLIAQAGGYTDAAERLVVGGAMMGLSLPHDQYPITKGCNCVLVLSAADVRPSAPEMPCIRCGECARVCPVRLAPQLLHSATRSADWPQAQALQVLDCIECGLCSLVCPSHIPLAEQFRCAKIEIKQSAHKAAAAELAKRQFEARNQRQLLREQKMAARRAQADNGTAVGDAVARARARKAKLKAPPD